MGRFRFGAIGRWRRLVVPLAVTLVTACVTSPRYGPDSPVTNIGVGARTFDTPPLVPRTVARAGIFASPEARTAVVTGGGGSSPRARFEVGDALKSTLDAVVGRMFSALVPVARIPTFEAPASDVEVVLVLRVDVDDYVFALELDVLAPNGTPIAQAKSYRYQMPAPDPGSVVDSAVVGDRAAGRVAELVADVAVGLVKSQGLAEWLARRGQPLVWAEHAEPTAAAAPSGVVIIRCSSMVICAETDETRMLGQVLKGLDSRIAIVSGAKFIDAMYPWLLGAPDLVEADVIDVLGRAAARERAASLGIRYFVDASLTSSPSTSGSILCTVGVPGGCFGYKEWNKYERAMLGVLDFGANVPWRRAEYSRSYTSLAMPTLLFPIPIPMGPAASIYDEAAKQLLPLLKPAD
jgi:hypothetical protein